MQTGPPCHCAERKKMFANGVEEVKVYALRLWISLFSSADIDQRRAQSSAASNPRTDRPAGARAWARSARRRPWHNLEQVGDDVNVRTIARFPLDVAAISV